MLEVDFCSFETKVQCFGQTNHSSNGVSSASSFFSAFLHSPFPFPSPIPFSHSTICYAVVPPKIQGLLRKIAWHRTLNQDHFQRLHTHISLTLRPPPSPNPNTPLICFANSESNDHLFVHCPFSWQLWRNLFRLIHYGWLLLSPPTLSSLNGETYWLPLLKTPKKLWNLYLHALMWLIWKKEIWSFLKIVNGIFLLFGNFSYYVLLVGPNPPKFFLYSF